MKFKLNAIAAVCALAFVGQAFAVGPTPSVAAGSTTKLFISGSSALQTTIGQIANGLFTPGSLSVFFEGTATATGASGKNYRAYAGTFSAASGLTGSGIMYETAAGGSINGVVPVAQYTNVARLDLSLDTNCTLQTAADAVTGGTLYSCVPTVAVPPDAGVSDVEPALFTGINVPTGGVAASAGTIAGLDAVARLAQPMGIIVTSNLYTAGVTNLTKAQVAGLMTGITADWSNLDFFATPAIAAGPVIVCRRTPGSGTQAAINDFFFGVPCSTSVLSPKTAQGNGTAYTVIENSSSGALAGCMTAAVNGTATGYTINITNGAISTAAPSATQIALAAGNRAIGLMGVDRPAGTIKDAGINGTSLGTVAIPEQYKFVSIGGVAPTVLNATLGAYDVVVNNSWNTRNGKGDSAGKPLLVDGVTNKALSFYNAIKTKSGDQAILGTSKIPAVPGVAALSDAIALNYDPTLNADGTLTNPAMRVTKSNSCQPAVQNQ